MLERSELGRGKHLSSVSLAAPEAAGIARSTGRGSTTPPLARDAPAPYLGGMENRPIHLSPAAASRVAKIAQKQGRPPALRLSVEGGGCSGFQYRFALAEDVEGEDLIVEEGGVRLVVDPVSLNLVRGSIVDYVESMGGAAFRVENPQAAAGCGCGASFAV